MMGKTHLAMGMATSLVVLHPTTAQECIIAVAGGALGGVIADIDTVKNDYKHDALIGQVLAVIIAGLSVLIDFLFKFEITQTIIERNLTLVLFGVGMYIVLAGIGFFTVHRTFTHSFLALVLFSIAIWCICPPALWAFVIGYLSHLFLDVLNKKNVPLLFPKGKGICLKLFYANKVANIVFMWVGFVGTVVLVVNATIYRFY